MDDMRKKKLFMDARPDQQVKEKLNPRPNDLQLPKTFILVWGCGHQYPQYLGWLGTN
jgi:hypothetical protein